MHQAKQNSGKGCNVEFTSGCRFSPFIMEGAIGWTVFKANPEFRI